MWITPEQQAAFVSAGTTAYALYSSPDCRVERFGADILVSYKHAPPWDPAKESCAHARAAGWEASRVYVRPLPKKPDARTAPSLVYGDASAAPEGEASEDGLMFGLDFAAGYSAGLFIDQRANRAHLRSLAPSTLLNCFAYTCSFSVAAAATGSATTNLDLSKKSLARGESNFAKNNLSEGKHRFIPDDVFDVLPRMIRRGDFFDAIVLDPPTFSRGNKGRAFQVEKELDSLFLLALEVAAKKAHILISTNCTNLTPAAIDRLARYGVKAARRSARYFRAPSLPDLHPATVATTLWVEMLD